MLVVAAAADMVTGAEAIEDGESDDGEGGEGSVTKIGGDDCSTGAEEGDVIVAAITPPFGAEDESREKDEERGG